MSQNIEDDNYNPFEFFKANRSLELINEDPEKVTGGRLDQNQKDIILRKYGNLQTSIDALDQNKKIDNLYKEANEIENIAFNYITKEEFEAPDINSGKFKAKALPGYDDPNETTQYIELKPFNIETLKNIANNPLEGYDNVDFSQIQAWQESRKAVASELRFIIENYEQSRKSGEMDEEDRVSSFEPALQLNFPVLGQKIEGGGPWLEMGGDLTMLKDFITILEDDSQLPYITRRGPMDFRESRTKPVKGKYPSVLSGIYGSATRKEDATTQMDMLGLPSQYDQQDGEYGAPIDRRLWKSSQIRREDATGIGPGFDTKSLHEVLQGILGEKGYDGLSKNYPQLEVLLNQMEDAERPAIVEQNRAQKIFVSQIAKYQHLREGLRPDESAKDSMWGLKVITEGSVGTFGSVKKEAITDYDDVTDVLAQGYQDYKFSGPENTLAHELGVSTFKDDGSIAKSFIHHSEASKEFQQDFTDDIEYITALKDTLQDYSNLQKEKHDVLKLLSDYGEDITSFYEEE